MDEAGRLLLKAVALLLRYPDEDFAAELPDLLESFTGCNRDPACCARVVDYFRESSLLEMQERYTALFDLNPATCLNLSYHLQGDGKARGSALAEFQQWFRQEGVERDSDELPDYLPMVLEFLSFCSPGVFDRVRRTYGEVLNRLAGRLAGMNETYGRLVGAAAEVIRTAES